jgi:Zn-dependent oligopeptidase
MREINESISSLTTEFQEKLLEMTRERAVVVEDEELLEGLSSDRIAAASEAAAERGVPVVRQVGAFRPDRNVIEAFARIGWQWGGTWGGSPDYQHFSTTGG